MFTIRLFASFVVVLPFQWLDIGKVSDYHSVMSLAVSGKVNNLEMPGTEIAKDVYVGLNVNLDLADCNITGPVYIGSGSTIEPHTTIVGPTVIGRGSVIQSGAYLERAVLFDYTFVSRHANVKDGLVIDGYFMDSEGNYFDLNKSDVEWLVSDSRIARRGLTEQQQELLLTISTCYAQSKRTKFRTIQHGRSD